MTQVLAADVGGTKILFAVFERGPDGARTTLAQERVPSRDYASLEEATHAFLAKTGLTPKVAAFGVAGPVDNDTCVATNLPWRIDARQLERSAGFAKAHLLNDFHTLALGLAELGPNDVTVLQDARPDPSAPIAVLGAGTGLGEAIAIPETPLPRVLASEGGHTDFAPRSDVEIDLLRFLRARQGSHVSYERVLSGPGLAAVYQFVIAQGLEVESAVVRTRMQTEDAGAVIGALGDRDEDPACRRALELFVSIYGAEAGNLALKVLPFGGLFVAGGIAAKILSTLKNGLFMKAFLDKGRMARVLANVRVSIVTHPEVGLLGARRAAEALIA